MGQMCSVTMCLSSVTNTGKLLTEQFLNSATKVGKLAHDLAGALGW
jgi:hypothetical protein